jgi:hypothetical protein
MKHSISLSHADLGNDAAVAAFLSGIPNADKLADLLAARHPVSTRAYDDDNETARFVRSDGHAVTCMAVVNVTIDEAEMIAAQCEVLNEWSAQGLADAVERALAEDSTQADGD